MENLGHLEKRAIGTTPEVIKQNANRMFKRTLFRFGRKGAFRKAKKRKRYEKGGNST